MCVGAFEEGQDDWTCYCERLEKFFQAGPPRGGGGGGGAADPGARG